MGNVRKFGKGVCDMDAGRRACVNWRREKVCVRADVALTLSGFCFFFLVFSLQNHAEEGVKI